MTGIVLIFALSGEILDMKDPKTFLEDGAKNHAPRQISRSVVVVFSLNFLFSVKCDSLDTCSDF